MTNIREAYHLSRTAFSNNVVKELEDILNKVFRLSLIAPNRRGELDHADEDFVSVRLPQVLKKMQDESAID